MAKNILITGSGGFVGKNIKEYLGVKYNLFTPRSFELNLLDENAVKDYLEENNIDTVIHCAAYGAKISTDATMEEVGQKNILMFQNISKNLSSKGFMLNLGSGAEYDKSKSLTKIKEEELGSSIPQDPYGYSKYVISKEIETNSNIINLRLFGVYGKYENESRFITYAINKNLTKKPIEINQNVVFDYLYIDDLCKIVEYFVKNKSSKRFLNITPTHSIDLLTIANIINKKSAFKSEIIVKNEGLNNEYTGDNTRLLQEIGDFTFTSYKAGINNLFEALQNNKAQNKMFTICIPTHNRHEILKSTLEAVSKQTYQNYEVFIVDRGSFPDVSAIIEEFHNEKFHYIKSSQEERLFQSFTNIVKNKMKGDYFLFLGDDDTLLPNALEMVAKTFDKNPQLEILQTGLVHYNLKNNTTTDSLEIVANQCSGELMPFDGEKLCLWYLSSWGIGKKFKMKHPKASHSSGFFIKKSLIKKMFDKDKNIFVEPFVDIGYVGCCYEAKTLYYLDLPLVIIGEGHIRETDGAKKNSRQKWDNEIRFFKHSPLEASSWQNCGMEGHLQVAYMQGLEKKYNLKLRPDFFRKHLSQILSDEPKTKQTLHDFLSAMPFYLKSYVDYPNFILKDMLRLCNVFKFFKSTRKIKNKKNSIIKFKEVKEYALYLNEFVTDKNKNIFKVVQN